MPSLLPDSLTSLFLTRNCTSSSSCIHHPLFKTVASKCRFIQFNVPKLRNKNQFNRTQHHPYFPCFPSNSSSVFSFVQPTHRSLFSVSHASHRDHGGNSKEKQKMSPQPCHPIDFKVDYTGRFGWAPKTPIEEQMALLFKKIEARDPDQKEFLQAFSEILVSLTPLFKENPKYLGVLETIAEPERAILFRVPWMDDQGVQRVNRGFRVQFSSTLGPYKGGLRFHPTVNLSVMKFLGFEQIFKNSLTGLPIGGGKGGSDFNPKGKSDAEVLRFCQSFMTSLYRHIGADTDVPAGDVNVGAREIGYLFGQYKRLMNQFGGVLTGKALNWGGSLIRPEATGYGAVYFAQNWSEDSGIELKGARCLVSGSGNVAQYTVEKLLQLGAVPLTMSDTSGYVYEPEGFTPEKLEAMMHIKNVTRRRCHEYCKVSSSAQFVPDKAPWEVKNIKYAFPSATQNEIDGPDAEMLARNGCVCIVEGSNMPSTPDAINVMGKSGITLLPAKAANAGGVAVSGLEMAQNSMRTAWTREEVDQKLKTIMKTIYDSCKQCAAQYGSPGNLQMGANIAGFLKVADSVIEQGCV